MGNTDNALDGLIEGTRLRSVTAGKTPSGQVNAWKTLLRPSSTVPLTVAMSSTMAYSKGVLESLNSLERYSPFSLERTVPRTGKPASRKALTV